MMRDPPVILVGDRDLLGTRPLRLELRRRGAVVYTATSGGALLLAAGRHSPDLVLVDQSLDPIGVEPLVRSLVSHHPRAHVIVMLATAVPGLEERSGAPDRVDCAARAADWHSLLERIGDALGDRLAVPETPDPRPALVMCVDDDGQYLAALKRLLAYHGYRVATFVEPERALAALAYLKPAVVIADLKMPGMDGRQLADEVGARAGRRVPVVLLSACEDSDEMLESYRHNICYYVQKSSGPRYVLNIVDYLARDLDMEEREHLELEL